MREKILNRLERLEQTREAEEGTAFFLNFAGRDAERVRDLMTGEVHERRDGEDDAAFTGRLMPRYGFRLVGAVRCAP